MKYVVCARHGDYDGRPDLGKEKLSSEGREQILKLSGLLKTLLEGNRVLLTSANSNRAVQSAEIIKNELKISEYIKISGKAREIRNLYFSRKDLEEDLIFVGSQCPCTDGARDISAIAGFGDSLIFNIGYKISLGTGQAVVLDLEKKAYSLIPEKKQNSPEPEPLPLIQKEALF